VGGIGVKLGGENHSLKTQTYEAGLVRVCLRQRVTIVLIVELFDPCYDITWRMSVH
jgi:hypothetical protein